MPRRDTDNEEQIERIRNRYGRVRLWYWLFLLMMPFGLVLLCIVGGALEGTARTAAWVAAVVVPVIGFGGVLLMAGDRTRYRNRLRVARYADELGLSYVEKGSPEDFERVAALPTFAQGNTPSAVSCIAGDYKGRYLEVLDYSYWVGPITEPTQYTQTVVAVGIDRRVPDFVLKPAGMFRSLKNLFSGEQPIEPGDKEFDRAFTLTGRDEDDVVGLFGDRLIDLCLAERDYAVVVDDGLLAVYRHNRTLKPDQYPDAIRHAYRLAKLLEEA